MAFGLMSLAFCVEKLGVCQLQPSQPSQPPQFWS